MLVFDFNNFDFNLPHDVALCTFSLGLYHRGRSDLLELGDLLAADMTNIAIPFQKSAGRGKSPCEIAFRGSVIVLWARI